MLLWVSVTKVPTVQWSTRGRKYLFFLINYFVLSFSLFIKCVLCQLVVQRCIVIRCNGDQEQPVLLGMARNLWAWACGREQHNYVQKDVNLWRREMLWKKAFSRKGSISPFLLSSRASGCDCKKMHHMKMIKVYTCMWQNG